MKNDYMVCMHIKLAMFQNYIEYNQATIMG